MQVKKSFLPEFTNFLYLHISGYRLGTSGFVYPGNNVGTTAVKEVETDCFEVCRQEATCLGWGFYWNPDLSKLHFLNIQFVHIYIFR